MANLHPNVVCLLALLLWLPVTVAQERPNIVPPNIVLIVVDDIGYSDFGAFGGEIETPHIDALAERGARFTNFHAASSCAPTRAMLLTGVDNHIAGVGSMRELMPFSHRGKPGYSGVLNDRVETIATRLQAAGYRTSIAGKWHLGTESRNLPPARGFDYSFIQADSGADNFEMRPYLPMKPEAYWYRNGERLAALPADFYSSRYFVDTTIEHLALTQAQQKPFFAYVAFQANHTPIQSPARFVDEYRGRYLEGWEAVRRARIQKMKAAGIISEQATLAPGFLQQDWNALSQQQQYFEARRMQAYAGMATAMDHQVGRLVEYLQEIGEYDNTVFLVLSDNGAVANEPYESEFARSWLEARYHREVETLGEKGSWVAAGRNWGRVANTPLSGQKFSASEGGVRVPLIISGMPLIRPGMLSHAFVHVTDIAPTVLEIAGLNPDTAAAEKEPIAGASVVVLFEDGAQALRAADEPIGYEFSGNAALYRGDFKLMRNQAPAGDGLWRLFNIKQDPGETVDLSSRRPDLYQSMQQDYMAYTQRTGVLPMPENYSLNRQVALNALIFVYLPRYLPYAVGVMLLFAAFLAFWRSRRSEPGK